MPLMKLLFEILSVDATRLFTLTFAVGVKFIPFGLIKNRVSVRFSGVVIGKD